MNGKKFKVSVHVCDHPPSYCNDWKELQKMSSAHKSGVKTEVNSLSVQNKPVYRTCLHVNVPDKRNRSAQEVSCGSIIAGINKPQTPEAKCESIDSNMEGMCKTTLDTYGESECSWKYNEKPLIALMKSTSLNINKLHKNNAVDNEEVSEQVQAFCNEKTDCGHGIVSCQNLRGKQFPHQRTGLYYLNNDSKAKHRIVTRLNGFNADLPTVINNSEKNSRRFGSRSCQMTTVNGGMVDDELPEDPFSLDRDPRPPLIREGSTCSSDSVITEIDGLSDDELVEMQANSAAQETSEESPKRSQHNWKKIRGMIHWAPFAKNYKKKFPWVQLAGHQGNFKAGESGTILKKTNEIEKECLIKLMKDVLQPYVPEFKREVENHEERYLVMQDLLSGFDTPSVMDCKMGVRTFLEDELEKARQQPKLRKDLYQKMIDIDPNAPTNVEREAGAITKPRYMKWREELSSSASLGFRIEGIKKSGEKPNKDFKTTRSIDELGEKFKCFINNDVNIKLKYVQRLKTIRSMLESSSFFKQHEVIGSSLLFVHDYHGNVNVWMIDFAKTQRVKDGIQLNHRDKWKEGNHEDGYLFGLDNMISIWSNI